MKKFKKIPGSAEVHFTSHNTTGDLIQSCAASLRLATEFVADLRSAYLARKRLAFLLRKNRENSRKITSGALLCSSSFSQLHSILPGVLLFRLQPVLLEREQRSFRSTCSGFFQRIFCVLPEFSGNV